MKEILKAVQMIVLLFCCLVDLGAIACVGGGERRFPTGSEEAIIVIIVITFWAFMSKKNYFNVIELQLHNLACNLQNRLCCIVPTC